MTNNAPRLSGKVAVVTGAGRGIGRAEAILLAREGARVIVNDLGGSSSGGGADPAVAEAVVKEIREFGGEAVHNTSDISTMNGANSAIQTALTAFGRLDILINNAGIARSLRIDETSEEAWDAIVDVNLKGSYATIFAAAPCFVNQGSGVILNTSSPSGFGQYSNAAYCAAKEGVAGLTRAVARDLGWRGVRCNTLRPVVELTNMSSLKGREAVKFAEEKLGFPGI